MNVGFGSASTPDRARLTTRTCRSFYAAPSELYLESGAVVATNMTLLNGARPVGAAQMRVRCTQLITEPEQNW